MWIICKHYFFLSDDYVSFKIPFGLNIFYTPKKKGQKIIRAMIKPIQYRIKRYDTFFFNHSESAIPIPRKVAIIAVTTVKKTPSAIVLLFKSNNFQSFFYHVVITENDALGFLNNNVGLYADSDKFSAISKFLVSGAYSAIISPAQVNGDWVAGASAGWSTNYFPTIGIFEKHCKIFCC